MTFSTVRIPCILHSNSWKVANCWHESRRCAFCPKQIRRFSSTKCAMPSSISTIAKLLTVTWSRTTFCLNRRKKILCWKSRILVSANWSKAIRYFAHCAAPHCKSTDALLFVAGTKSEYFVSFFVRYVAPEVLLTNGKGEYTEKVDIWSLGVVLFTMLSGTLPFADEYGTPATEQIKNGRFQFRSNNWSKVSPVAKQLIKELLTTNVKRRPSIDQLLKHKWLADYSMISTAHRIMDLPLPSTYEKEGTRMALNVPQCEADSTSGVFARPYQVDVDSENVQSSKRRRLR